MQPFSTAHLLLQSTSTLPLRKLLPRLQADLHRAGAWVTEAHDLTPGAAELHLELPPSAAEPLYTALIRSGLHLSRSAHVALATLCSWERPTSGRMLELKLEIRFLAPSPDRLHLLSTISA